MRSILINTLLLVLLVARNVSAQEPSADLPLQRTASISEVAADDDSTALEEIAHANLHDPAFEHYIDMHLLVDAINNLDQGGLTDAGLQLAEGERVLGRSHKKVSADQVLLFAYKLATDANDKESLSKLKKIATSLDKKKLSDAIANSEKLAGNSRLAVRELVVPISASPEQFLFLKRLAETLRRARLLRSPDAIRQVTDALNEEGDLPSEQREQLKVLAADAAKQIEGKSDESESSLLRLVEESRFDIKLPHAPPIAKPFPPPWPKPPIRYRTCPYCSGTGKVPVRLPVYKTDVLK